MLSKGFRLSRRYVRVPRKVNDSRTTIIEVPQFDFNLAMKMVRASTVAMKDDIVYCTIKLNVDARRGDQVVRGSSILPNGSGKDLRICFVCKSEENKQRALAAGADMVIDELMLEQIAKEEFIFDKLYSTPDGLQIIRPYARQLGQNSLFPNAKVNTLIQPNSIEESMKEAKMGKVDFRVDLGNSIIAPIGKVSFNDDKLKENIFKLTESLIELKPSAVKIPLVKGMRIRSTNIPNFEVYLEDLYGERFQENYIRF